MNLGPDTGLGPIVEPTPATHAAAAAEFLGKKSPGGSRAKNKEDAGKSFSIGNAGSPAFGLWRFGRKERRNLVPKRFGKKCERHRHSYSPLHPKS
jgi:hypothetical protein